MAARPKIIAHRGASAHRAEHTLAAYALAIEQGADGLECDVRLSRDGHLVCVHDRTLTRTSNGRGVVSELDLAELAAYDYGHWHDGRLESADDLVRVPTLPDRADRGLLTLDDLLGLVTAAGPDVRLFVETKHPVRYGNLVEAKLIAMLARHGLAAPAHRADSQVVVMSFSSRAVRWLRRHAPALPTALLFNDLSHGRRDGSLPPWVDIAGPGVHILRADPTYPARAGAHGHDVYCWTVEDQSGLLPGDPEEALLCQRLGVTYFATNFPAETRRLLDAI